MEKLKHIVVFVIVVLSFSSCKDEPQTKEEVILPKVETETTEEAIPCLGGLAIAGTGGPNSWAGID